MLICITCSKIIYNGLKNSQHPPDGHEVWLIPDKILVQIVREAVKEECATR